MTIVLNEEQTGLIREVVEAGAAQTAEVAIDQAVRALHTNATEKRRVYQQVDNLADLFARSPFRGFAIGVEREKDYGRDVSLGKAT